MLTLLFLLDCYSSCDLSFLVLLAAAGCFTDCSNAGLVYRRNGARLSVHSSRRARLLCGAGSSNELVAVKVIVGSRFVHDTNAMRWSLCLVPHSDLLQRVAGHSEVLKADALFDNEEHVGFKPAEANIALGAGPVSTTAFNAPRMVRLVERIRHIDALFPCFSNIPNCWTFRAGEFAQVSF